MVRALEQEQESYRSRLFHFKGLHDNASRHAKSLSIESASKLEDPAMEDGSLFRIASKARSDQPPPEKPHLGRVITRTDRVEAPNIPKSRLCKEDTVDSSQNMEKLQQDMEQMKERFAKLLLGEDMSGGGKGVSSALALSNAITNLAASAFSEQNRLEPMAAETKAKWRKEIDWLLSVADHIVEFVPSQQKSKDGSNMEIMVTRQRTDLHMNIPALRKLDAMLLDCLDNFKDKNEFNYVSRDAPDSEKGGNKRKDDKWWLPTVKVPEGGLSEMTRKFLQFQKDCVNQVLKAAMAINSQVLSEMEIPENYIESLPKNGRASLGDSIYRSITVEFFNPDQFLSTMDLSSEHKILDLKNRIEASIVIWKRKMNQKDGKSAWGSAVSLEKRELFEERAETILIILKQRFPGIPQSSLDISKIQYNKDVGQAVLESYSRILESLAYTVLSRIEDVLYADYATKNPTEANDTRNPLIDNELTGTECLIEHNTSDSKIQTLLDFMGWDVDQGENEERKDPENQSDEPAKEGEGKFTHKLTTIVTQKRISYLESLSGLRSPTARH
ncbi:rop guanine nucleotide exchange factor 12 [Pistacia vera]|uniref:rop guanine nucleotide exchange factor 12 n=1 Tax=Pistacia vera TaxID=55513 RepID=UPI001263DE4C|nr:rop guanine nucleotide exchange factor 12 [Pistacia vera]